MLLTNEEKEKGLTMREFTKVSYKGDEMLIKWLTAIDEEEINYESELKTKKAPHGALIKALKDLAQDVPVFCEWPDDLYKQRIKVNSVSITHFIEGGFSAAIQAQVGLNCGQTIPINTPRLKTEGEPHEMITEECIHRFRKLMKEADVFLKNAASKQTELFPADRKAKTAA